MRRFKVDEKVRVKYFDKRPEHWNDCGDMDKYMGEIVTIKEVFCYRSYDVIIKEDDFWTWDFGDFEEIVEDFLEDKDMLI